ncbi:MAG TPA: ATP-binding cassette domain-containing protein, partial [Anaerolineae bacterium]
LVDNRAGIYMDGMPFSPEGYGHIRENVIAFNDVALLMLPAVRGTTIEKNTFWENVEQVSIAGGGRLGANKFQGNYWSDYSGFDANRDGVGDVPYEAENLFEGLTDREPMLRMLIYSPAQQAIEFASAAFPVMRPKPKFTDPAPSLQPMPLPPFAANRPGNAGTMTLAALALLGLSGTFGVMAMQSKNGTHSNHSPNKALGTNEHSSNRASIVIANVTKRYGKVKALEDVSFEVQPGEALALWGSNGAGKTTLIKAILGLIDFQGSILVQAGDVRRAPKLARRHIGYVPQEAVFYDLSVQATVDFYARLKKADRLRAASLLARVGLADHAFKPVPALSGGLKQRLALAIALLADPPVLLLDEPTANLDSQARRDYLELLASLHHEGKTIVFASHRIEEVEAIADRVLVIQDGKLDQLLTPEQLRAQFAPEVQMTLWVTEVERAKALVRLKQEGVRAHANGRGTIVVQVRTDEKMVPLKALREVGVSVLDFEIEGISSWN